MLDARLDQGASLHQITPAAAPSLLAVVSHGDRDAEMATLWLLCAAVEGFGYPVVVLDGSTREEPGNPGLQDLLDSALALTPLRSDDEGWTVLPAAVGLRSLGQIADQPGDALPWLGHLLSPFGVVVVYADADALGTILRGSDIRPLFAVSPAMTSLISAYRAVKQLVIQSGLTPLVATISHEANEMAVELAQRVNRSLLQCAQTHLGCTLESMIVRTPLQASGHSADARKLALCLLEGAQSLAPPQRLAIATARSH